jgi:hypothetical protein|tara:strand:+ start:385 stop:546 length:162 start_codon:yes stop_codon:yes gene_type:complete
MGIIVCGGKGRTGVDDNGDQCVWNEMETESVGNDVFYPHGEGYEIFKPEGSRS